MLGCAGFFIKGELAIYRRTSTIYQTKMDSAQIEILKIVFV
jgi:hypothetical protein